MKNYVLFIGGTGARVYRSFLHLCASGVVQSETITTLLLDADLKNRAVTDCGNLYDSYQIHHNYIYNKEKSDSDVERTSLFHCNVQMVTEETVSPMQEGINCLIDVAKEDPAKKRAMSWFYTKGEREQNLEHGFYARPNIGCVFFQNLINSSINRLLDSIRKDLEDVESSINVVLVGSIFGGTGASGLPSILKMLRSKYSNTKIHYYGVLVTPYFEVPKSTGTRDEESLVIQSKNFNCNTRTALKYYKDHGEFDRIYLVGKTALDQINKKYSNGGESQDNKAHIVEVYSAMAIRDCLEGDQGGGTWRRHIIDTEPINWIGLGSDMYPIADMIRTQVVLDREIYPLVQSIPSERKQLWGYRQWVKVFDIGSSTNRKQLQDMQNYTNDFLRWMYDVQSIIGPTKQVPDSQIDLCKALVTDFAVFWNTPGSKHLEESRLPTVYNSFSRDSKNRSSSVLGQFNKLIDTASNIEYVFDKIVLILSCLGMANKGLANLGVVGILIKLFEIAGQKKKKRNAAG